MKISYYKSLSRKLAVVSIVCLSSLSAIAFHSEAIAGSHSGGAGKSEGKGVGNSINDDRSKLIKAENASDIARAHAAHNSAVYLAEFPNHFDDGHIHNSD